MFDVVGDPIDALKPWRSTLPAVSDGRMVGMLQRNEYATGAMSAVGTARPSA